MIKLTLFGLSPEEEARSMAAEQAAADAVHSWRGDARGEGNNARL